MIETAKVPVAKVAAWPSPSRPSARPDTMTNPAAPKSAEMSRVSLRPAAGPDNGNCLTCRKVRLDQKGQFGRGRAGGGESLLRNWR